MGTGTTNAYSHPKLNEFLEKAAEIPYLGQVLIQTVRDLVHPQDRVLVCHAMVETSGATEDQEFTYYSVNVMMVTTAFVIRILFYPKTHMAIKKRVHQITELKFEYPAPPMAELANATAENFIPGRVKLEVVFGSDKGNTLDTWVGEASDPDHVSNLLDVNRVLSRIVGLPLAQAAGAAAGTLNPA